MRSSAESHIRLVTLAVVGVLIVVGAWIFTIRRNAPPVGYTNLEDLVSTMATAIERNDEEQIQRLCHQPLEVGIDRLLSQHARLNYITLLHQNRMWKLADSWTLGGHGQEFGHIHLDFVKQLDGKWYLKRIWECR